MAEILTTQFKSDTTRLFIEDIVNSDMYIMCSAIERIDAENSQFSDNEFKERILFGKQVYNDDVHFMIKYYPWQRDEVFVQYDDAIDLEDQKFYAVVGPTNNDTGDYRIFKCLFNNDNAPVEAPPAWNANTDSQIYQTADGYLWKYMYDLSDLNFEAYNALGYIPIKSSDFVVDPVANTTGGEVSDIFVTNLDDNLGYTKVTGSLSQAPYSTRLLFCRPNDVNDISQIFFYYYGQTLYVTNNDNAVTNLFNIEFYQYNTTTGEVQFRVDRDPVLAGVSQNASWQILPRIQIDGDGTGAVAIPVIDSRGRIRNTTLLSRGSAYNNVVARVVDPLYDFSPNDPTRTDTRAILRPILSPVDGHGHDLIDEFKCHHFGIYAYITGEDNLLIGANNTYSTIGLVKNPEFRDGNNVLIASNDIPSVFDNRIAVTTDDFDKTLVNGIVQQLNADQEVVFKAVVHDIDYSSNTLYLAEYMGEYQNQANSSNSLDLNLNLRNETGQLMRINTPIASNVIEPTYVQRSGRTYFVEDFFALPRTENSREEFKFVMEF